MAPGKSVLVVMFTQADPARTDALAYVRNKDDGLALADYVVITPRVERPDPCEAMRKRASTPPKADPPPKEPGAKP